MIKHTPNRSPLRSDAKLILMTRQAQRLVHGRSARVEEHRTLPGIIGLLKFAAMLRIIWDAAMNDDPYADLWLVRVDQALRQSQEDLSKLSEHLEKLFGAAPDAVSVDLATSDAPLEVALRFANPYAFVGAYLLGEYDHFVRQVLTANHVGMIPHLEAQQSLSVGGRQIRRAYMSASGYRALAVTRKDMLAGNARARQAQAQLGELPEDVLKGERLAPHAIPRTVAAEDKATMAPPPGMQPRLPLPVDAQSGVGT